MNTVLVVSYAEDAHAKHLMSVAEGLGISVILWDVSQYPRNDEVAVRIFSDSTKPETISLGLSQVRFASNEIKGVWWRRPGGAKKEGEQTSLQKYIQIESEFVIRSLRDFLPDANWVSDPEATRLSCRKPVQLKIARDVGFRIPDTCVTNSPEELKRFIHQLDGEMIMKAVGSAFIPLDPKGDLGSSENRVVFTRIVEPSFILENIEMVRNCPVIFQEAIRKDFDLRVTVADTDVYAAEIRLEGYDDLHNLDWRDHAGNRVYSTHILPFGIQKLCIDVVQRLGLRFGCVDLGFSEKEGYTFFEVNPQGQWLPSEQKLGYTIARSILGSLMR